MADEVTTTEEAPILPGPVEILEYYPGFGREYEQTIGEYQSLFSQMQKAEEKLRQPTMLQEYSQPGVLAKILRFIMGGEWGTRYMEPYVTEELRQKATQENQIAFDAAVDAFKVAKWKVEVMNDLYVLLADTEYTVESAADILKYVGPGPDVELSDADTAWLNSLYSNMQHLSNVLPEGYQGDILDVQSKVLNEILSEEKLELAGVHKLTVEEIAKAFVFGVAELPEGMTAEDVRGLLSQMELEDEELQNQHEWLEERIRQWEIESARMSMIRASSLLAETPELTPLQWAKLMVTQPMMATVELMQGWWDTISRPISAAIMVHTPAPVSGAIHGAALGAAAGGTVGAILAPLTLGISIPVAAGIGALIGAAGGAAWFSTWEDEASKELTKIYEFYVSEGDSSWSAYAKAFNEWEAPWWQKMILDSAYDPLMWLGWGGVAAVGNKIAKIAAPRGLKWFTRGIGTTMSAFERGFIAGTDIVFKAGMEVIAAPAKFGFWLTGAGYTIPKTLFQMSKNFGRRTMQELLAIAQQRFSAARLVRGKLVGISTKDFQQLLADVTAYALKNPTSGDTMARAGIGVMEFAYRNADDAAKLLKGLVDDAVWDTVSLARLNDTLAKSITGFVNIPGMAVINGDRMAAGRILSELGKEATDDMVNTLAKRIGKFKEGIAGRLIDSVSNMSPGDAIYHIFDNLVNTRYANLQDPITTYMGQAGRSVSWHSRVADRILHSARLMAFERKFVMPFAKHQLLFTNFGPYNYLENSMRSFLGGAEAVVPKAYSGVDETLAVLSKLSGCPYDLVMFQKGETRLVQAIVNPETGRALVFKKGNIPVVTRGVTIPEKIPRFGGKQLGMTISIGDKQYYLASFQDWYDMWADLVGKQMAYDYQVHFTKAVYETPLGKETIDNVNGILARNRYILRDNVTSLSNKDIADIERLERWLSLNGPEDIRAMSNVDVLTYQRRLVGAGFNKARAQMHDIHRAISDNLYDQIIDGSMFIRGYDSIDDSFAGALAGSRDLNVASLSAQSDAIRAEADYFSTAAPRTLDDFMGDLERATADAEAIAERLHDYRSLIEMRKGQLIGSEIDDFEVGSAKQLTKFMEDAEESMTKIFDQLVDSAKAVGMTDDQIARFIDIEKNARLRLGNTLTTRNKLAEIESEIPAFHSRIKKLWSTNPDKAAKESDLFWRTGPNSQRARKSVLWDEFNRVDKRLKSRELLAKRNFLTSVDKSVYVPDSVPEIVDYLTPNHLAYLYGVTGDDLYRGLTRMHHHATIRPKEDFIIYVREQADAYGAKFGKTADQLGFTEEAIGDVYDQMWRSLGIDPYALAPDSPTVLELKGLKDEVYRLYAANRVPADEVGHLRRYFNTVADEVGGLDVYKGTGGKYVTQVRTAKIVQADLDATTSAIGYLAKVQKGVKISDEELTLVVMALRDAGVQEGELVKLARRLKPGEQIDTWIAKLKVDQKGLRSELAEAVAGRPKVTEISVPEGVPKAERRVYGTTDWWTTKESAMTKARELHALSYPTYDDANIIDETMRAIFPFWCVPEDTKILTKTGWKHYTGLNIGEDVLTVNPESLVTEWQPVQEIAEFDYDDKLMVIPARGKDIKFTPNHRWLTITSVSLKPKIKRGYELTDTYDVIPRALPHVFPSESILEPRLAAILGWVVAEGYLNSPKTQRPYFIIYQSRHNYIDEIEAATGTKAHPRSKLNDPDNMVIRVSADDTAKITEVYSGKDSLPAIIPQLSKEAADAMFRAILLGEGSFGSAYNGTAVDEWSQQSGPVSEAFQMLCILLGKAITVGKKNRVLDKIYFINNTQPYQAKQCRRMRKEHYAGKVWCPVTANGTWFANFNGSILPTGNTYELFRWKWLPRTFMRTPGVMSGLARYMNYTDSGYVPVPGTDLQINILRGTVFMGGLRSFYLRDFPEFHDAIPGIEFLDYIGRAGFFPGIHVMGPIVGISSLASGQKFQWGELAPSWVKSGLSALRSLSPQHIGAVLDLIYPDRFRDYMTMMELASMGYDGDEIWRKKQQGQKLTEEEEKLWLTAVNKVDGVKGVLMNQTGLFRIRPAEFTQLRQSMRLAIEEATGVPVRTQEWIDKMYPVTGKRFSDYFHLDVQQQALLYQWESYRRYQGIVTPLYPSSWQALDIKTSEYYNELERLYNDSRYNGIYEDGQLKQQSMLEINRQLVEGIIGPGQWVSMRSEMQGNLSAAVQVLGESPAYKDVPKTFEERAALLEERGIVTPTKTPDQELLYYYYELEPELKYNWESDRMELDFDTYYAYIDILLESLSPAHRERLLERIQNDWTPMERLYWQFSREYARPYRNVRSVVLNEYTDEEVKKIRRFEVARGAERTALLEEIGPDGKLIAGYQKRLREARLRLRILDPTLDAWLYFFGTTDTFRSNEAEEIYNQLKAQYLVPGMIGEAK